MATNARTFCAKGATGDDIEIHNFAFQSNRKSLSYVAPIIVYGDIQRTFAEETEGVGDLPDEQARRKRTKIEQEETVKVRLDTCKSSLDKIQRILNCKELQHLRDAGVIGVPEYRFRCSVSESYLRKKNACVPCNWNQHGCRPQATFHGIASTFVPGTSLFRRLRDLDTPAELDAIQRFGIIDVEDMMTPSVPENWNGSQSVYPDVEESDGTRFSTADFPSTIKPSDFMWWRLLSCLAPVAKKCDVLVRFYSSVLVRHGRPIVASDFEWLTSDVGGYFSTRTCKVLLQTQSDVLSRLAVLEKAEFVTDADDMDPEHAADMAWNRSICSFFVRLITDFALPLATACNAHSIVWYDCKPDNIIVM